MEGVPEGFKLGFGHHLVYHHEGYHYCAFVCAFKVGLPRDLVTFATDNHRWLARKLFHPGEGQGPTDEARRGHRVEWRGVAIADEDSENPRKAFVTVQSTIDPYSLTALCMVQAANSILHNTDTLAAQLGGGILTPATLASPELFRLLDRAGLKIEAKII